MNFLARNEHRLIVAWLGLWTAALGGFAIFGIALQGAERVVDRLDERWTTKVERGRQLVADGNWPAAEAWLAQLDREHPARHVLYARDREREEVMLLLGRSRLALGKKRATLETLEGLVEFDPLNWQNHDELRRAQLALAEPDLAAATAQDLLALHGTHWPSVAGLVEWHADAGRFEDAVSVFERYLDTYRLAPLTLAITGQGSEPISVTIDVPADGKLHEVAAWLELPPTGPLTLSVATGGYSVELNSLHFVPPLLAGRVASSRGARALADPLPIASSGGRLEGRRFLADEGNSEFVVELSPIEAGASRVHLEVRVYKHVTRSVWKRIEQCLINLVDPTRAAALAQRVVVGGCLEGGTLFP